eukprot:1161251-Pelagomonas_calceolata.AAC.5
MEVQLGKIRMENECPACKPCILCMYGTCKHKEETKDGASPSTGCIAGGMPKSGHHCTLDSGANEHGQSDLLERRQCILVTAKGTLCCVHSCCDVSWQLQQCIRHVEPGLHSGGAGTADPIPRQELHPTPPGKFWRDAACHEQELYPTHIPTGFSWQNGVCYAVGKMQHVIGNNPGTVQHVMGKSAATVQHVRGKMQRTMAMPWVICIKASTQKQAKKVHDVVYSSVQFNALHDGIINNSLPPPHIVLDQVAPVICISSLPNTPSSHDTYEGPGNPHTRKEHARASTQAPRGKRPGWLLLAGKKRVEQNN